MADETPASAPASATPPAAAPAAAPAPAPPSSSGTTPWQESLPEGLKTDKTLRDFKDVGALANSYLEMKRWQSGAIKKPGPDAKPEELARYRESLGVPKAPSDYTLKAPDGSNAVVDPKRLEAAAPVFHRLGLTQDQAQGLAEWAAGEERARAIALNESYLSEMDAYADKVGKAEFDRQCQLVDRVMDRFAPEAMRAALNEANAKGSGGFWHTNNPLLFQLLAPIAKQFAEDGIIDGRVDGVPDAAAAQEKIAALGKELMQTNQGTPRYTQLLTERENLFKLLYGTHEVGSEPTRR